MQALIKTFRSSTPAFAAAAGLTAAAATAVTVSAAETTGTPQPTVIESGYSSGAFVIIHLAKGADLKAVGRACSSIGAIASAVSTNAIDNVGTEVEEDTPAVVASVSFSGRVWEGLKGSKPNGLTEYKTRVGKNDNSFPATGGDILLHIKGVNKSVCFEVVDGLLDALPPKAVHVVQDFYGFKYQDGRDLSGFIDGTANPGGDEDRLKVAVIPSGPNAGGSTVMAQVWEHDLAAVKAASTAKKEAIIGRVQPTSANLKETAKASHFHVLTEENEGSGKVEVVRHSMPFGSHGGKHGLFFICYGASSRQMDFLLDRMIGSADLPQDRTFELTKPVTGQYFYVPSVEQLASLA